MERFFILDKFNTYYDWNFILTEKDVTPPTPKTNYVTLDGVSGSLDLSEALSGSIEYEDRTITASFLTDYGTYKDRESLYNRIVTAIHGRKISLVDPDDPYSYYIGRVKVKSWKNTLPYAELSIEATCEPWRYAQTETVRCVEVDGVTDIVINYDGVKILCPTITVTGSVDITHNETTTSLTEGTFKISDFKITPGVNVYRVSGNGSVTLTYREATL